MSVPNLVVVGIELPIMVDVVKCIEVLNMTVVGINVPNIVEE